MPTRRQRFPMSRPPSTRSTVCPTCGDYFLGDKGCPRCTNNRAKDAVNLAPGNLIKDEERLPDISEMGLPSGARKRLTEMAAKHVELGSIQRTAEKERKTLTENIKIIAKEYISLDETPKFYIDVNRVAFYVQNRDSLDKEVLKAELLNMGVSAEKIARAFAKATKTTRVETLRITAPGEDE